MVNKIFFDFADVNKHPKAIKTFDLNVNLANEGFALNILMKIFIWISANVTKMVAPLI